MRTLIADDEKKNIVHLRKILQQHYPQVHIVGEAGNAKEAIALITATRPELLLLDIVMPGASAFDMLRDMGSYDFDVIFITGYNEYALQAIKFSALDYLLKPVQPKELGAALQKAEERRLQRQTGEQIRNLLSILSGTQQREHKLALVLDHKEIRFTEPSAIIRCEADDCYTRFHFVSGEQLVVTKGLYEYEALLAPYGFIRCHRSHIVNRSYIKSYLREDWGELVMADHSSIPVSRSYRISVRQALLLI
jgi:two-component system LytT family response regulator